MNYYEDNHYCIPVRRLDSADRLQFPEANCTGIRAGPASNLNSRGLQKLTPAQVEEKIKAVQANPAIPDTAKPKVIESIRAQGEP